MAVNGKVRGQEGECGGQGDQDDQYRPNAQGLEEGEWDDEHPAQGYHHGHPAEQHRASRRRAGALDGLVLVQAPGHLVPEAGYDEDGVVDPHGQADHDDHQRDEEDQVEGLADQRGYAQGDYYAHDGQAYGHEHGDEGPEEDHEDDQGNGNADPLALSQVLLRQLVLLVGYAGVSHEQHPEALLAVRLLDHLHDVLNLLHRLFKGAGHEEGHYGRHAVDGDEGRVVALVVVGQGCHDVGSQGGDLPEHRIDPFLEPLVVHGEGV